MELGHLRPDRRPELTAASISQAPLRPLPDIAPGTPRMQQPEPPKRGRRGLLRILAVILAVGGSLLLIDAGLTLVWQEPITGLYAHFAQGQLNGDLQALDRAPPSAGERRALADARGAGPRMAVLARQLQRTAPSGAAVGRINIPRIGANDVVVSGTDVPALKKGPGIYAQTSFPGLAGTVAIAGHRTTYLAPFRRINELVGGNRISIEMPYGRFVYTVQRHRIVSPNEVSVLRSGNRDQLVLTACHPLYSAAQRWVVFASLTSSQPRGAALNSALGLNSAPVTAKLPMRPRQLIGSGPGMMLLGSEPSEPPPSLAPSQGLLLGQLTSAPPLPNPTAGRRVATSHPTHSTPGLPSASPVHPVPPLHSTAPAPAAPIRIPVARPAPRQAPQKRAPASARTRPPHAPAPAPPSQRQIRVQGGLGRPAPVGGSTGQDNPHAPVPSSTLVGGG